MIRLSFRQSMLAGFLLIALLLGWATVRSWLLVEEFVDRSERVTRAALEVSASVQDIAERTTALERSARQYRVLQDPQILLRVSEQRGLAEAALRRAEAAGAAELAGLARQWREAAAALAAQLEQVKQVQQFEQLEQLAQPPTAATRLPAARSGIPTTPLAGDAAALAAMAEASGKLDGAGRRWISEQASLIEAALEAKRREFTLFVAATVAGAFIVALAMSWWLARPLAAVQRTIEALGQSRFDEPVLVHGPADLREVGRRLDWLRLRLQALESERERSLRHVSHELKTPLTALREGIDLLREEVVGTLDGTQAEVVGILQHNVMTLQRQLESLLRLNAIAFEARRLHHRPLAIDRLLAGVVQGRELQIQARKLSVECSAPAATCHIDGEKLQVALDNLLSNAIDFSPEGAVIRLEAKLAGERLQVACIDQGTGVAADDVERIFEPFVQGRRAPPAPRQGSGVGLSIVRELMGAMGGSVRVHAGHAGGGATFEIELPCGR